MDLLKILKTLGPAPKGEDLSLPHRASKMVHAGMVAPCQLCGKHIEVLAQKFSSTDRVTGAYDVICDACSRDYDRTAKLVCVTCRQVIGRLKPRRTDTGFDIRPGVFYHTDKCNVCAPGLRTSVVLEIKAFEALNKK